MFNTKYKHQTPASWINNISTAKERYYPVWLGYNDKRAGRGFSKEYDDKPVTWQQRYELGRLLATDLDFLAPSWPNPTTFPNSIQQAFIQAIQTNLTVYDVRPSQAA